MNSGPLKNDIESSVEVDVFLEHGFHFKAGGFGDFSQARSGEFVFCTAMSGIEESLTDPSFAKQVLVSTLSHVGNTGVTIEDMESSKVWAEGLVCRHLSVSSSHWRNKKSLQQWMLEHGRFVLHAVDTRRLTQVLRDQGSQRGVIVASDHMNKQQALQFIKEKVSPMQGLNLIEEVSCIEPYQFDFTKEKVEDTYWPHWKTQAESKLKIAVWDFGVKKNTLRLLGAMGAQVHVMPARAKAGDLLSLGASGVLLSNGPGDPAAATYLHQELKQILGRVPMYAICLGHQLVAHAVGAKTYKMPFGHRGIHHPVVQRDRHGEALRVWITSQNHGFAVDRESLPKNCHVSFDHADDGSVEGLSLPDMDCETVQFHPEAAPGPYEGAELLHGFVKRLKA